MYTQQEVVEAAEKLKDATFKRQLQRKIALGISKLPGSKLHAWLTLEVVDGRVLVHAVAFVEKLEDPDKVLGVDIAILSEPAVWSSITKGGRDAVVEAAVGLRLSVAGKLGVFIRFLDPIVDLMVESARCLPSKNL